MTNTEQNTWSNEDFAAAASNIGQSLVFYALVELSENHDINGYSIDSMLWGEPDTKDLSEADHDRLLVLVSEEIHAIARRYK